MLYLQPVQYEPFSCLNSSVTGFFITLFSVSPFCLGRMLDPGVGGGGRGLLKYENCVYAPHRV